MSKDPKDFAQCSLGKIILVDANVRHRRNKNPGRANEIVSLGQNLGHDTRADATEPTDRLSSFPPQNNGFWFTFSNSFHHKSLLATKAKTCDFVADTRFAKRK